MCDKKDRNYAPTVTAEAVSAALFLWLLNTRLPTKPARLPPATANASARTTWRGGLNANGARSPGIGDADPGALLMIWKTAAEIPARAEEIHHAVEEGIDFRYLTNPVAIKGDEEGHVCGIECVKMELGEPDASGRRRPVEIKDSNFVLDVDCVIMAIGTKLNTLILDTTKDLEANSKGGIGTDDEAATSRPGIFAGGDAVTGAATVIKAMGAGKVAAAGIDEYLSK